MTVYQLREAETKPLLAEAARLFGDYARSIGIDLEFQGFSRELASLPGDYAPPDGAILLLMDGERAVACVALRKLEVGICEMKRMYVAPEGRGRKLGRRLAAAVIRRAQELGYLSMRLDTLSSMTAARSLYQSLGFVPIAPYCHNPLPDAEYYQLDLGTSNPGES
jgi:ribosomal protein S18 acetylase RimI-like enzyme